jgi:hypothetical protein
MSYSVLHYSIYNIDTKVVICGPHSAEQEYYGLFEYDYA